MYANSYDEVPYLSYHYYRTSIDNLYTISSLFGIKAPDCKKCKVLELGCSSGSNIIPVAFKYPDSSFIGVDYSIVQIEKGRKQVVKLGLKNIDLQHLSIMDIDEDFGIFDYIIVHGVISWVSKEIQEKIFDICNKNLVENGIVYISYNTFPGWNMLKTIRDMMLYHTSFFEDKKEKAHQARLLLEFVKEGSENKNTPYSLFLESEFNYLSEQSDYYLIHDYLEGENNPFYFHEFISKAEKYNLKYIGDVLLSSMYTGNLPKNVSKKLQSISDDIAHTEQYMDFISNRRFRSSVLCHDSIELNRSLEISIMSEFSFISKLKSVKEVTDFMILSKENVDYTVISEVSFKTNNSVVVVMLKILEAKAPSVTTSNDLINLTFDNLNRIFKRELYSKKQVEEIIFDTLMRLVFANYVRLFSEKNDTYITEISEFPEVSELTRVQASEDNWVTTNLGEVFRLDAMSQIAVRYLDGKTSVKEVIEKIHTFFSTEKITLITEEELSEKFDKTKEFIEDSVKQILESFRKNALLIS